MYIVLIFVFSFLSLNAAIVKDDIQYIEKSDVYNVVDIIQSKDTVWVLLHDTFEDKYQAYIIFNPEYWSCPVLYPTLLARYADKIPYCAISNIYPDIKDKYGFNCTE